MDIAQLYLSREGRLNRKGWWLGNIGLIIILVLLSIVLGLVVSLLDLAESAIVTSILNIGIFVIVLVPVYNLTVKRLRDRARPLNLAFVFIVPGIVAQILQSFGITGSMQPGIVFGQEVEVFQQNSFGMIVTLINLVIALWGLVELGILPGRSNLTDQTISNNQSDSTS